MSFSVEQIHEVEAHLLKHPTLTEGGQPGPLDAYIYLALGSNPSSI
jgi:hypothetical protein